MRLALLSLLFALTLAAPAAADSIAYIKDANVWVAQPDGSDARALTTDGGYSSPSQADDGTVLVVRGSQFVKLDRKGNKLATFASLLTDKPGTIVAVGPFDARISPDGTKFAYWIGIMGAWKDFATGIVYTDPQSSVAYQSATDGTPLGSTMFFEEPSWTADGRVLLFDSINGGVPQVYSGAVGMNHNDLTPWFHDLNVFSEPDGWRPTGAGELSRSGTRLAALRAGGTMGAGYEARGRYNRIQLYSVNGLDTPPAPECQIAGDSEFGPPSWAPGGDALAWATPEGIYTSKVCDGFAATLIVPGGGEPDWGPAEPGAAAASDQPQQGAQTGPTLTSVKTRRGRVVLKLSCACKATVVARKGKRVVGRATGTQRVTLKLSKRVRGKLKLTVTVGATKLTKSVKIR